MGADLYITEPAKAKFKPLFDVAVRQRDKLSDDLKGFEQLAARYKELGLPKSLGRVQRQIAVVKERIERCQATVEKYYNAMYPSAGYFRDSYNGTSVLWRLNLSWWKDTSGGNMTIAKLKSLLDKVKARKLKPLTKAELVEMCCLVDDGENSVQVWQKMFRNKKRRLIRFLERAIHYRKKGGAVYFSL